MAKKNDKDLIGFDPLAWMDEGEEATVADDTVKEEAVVGVSESMKSEETVIDSKLMLDATLNIQSVSRLYERLVTILDNHEKVEIDASAVETVDTASLQLLIVFKQAAIKLQKEVTLDFPSDRFVESSQLLGLAEMLGVEQAAAGLF